VLAATDEPAEWWIDLNDPSTARPDHAKADPILQGSQSSLLLWLTHRAPDGSLKMISYREIATSWGPAPPMNAQPNTPKTSTLTEARVGRPRSSSSTGRLLPIVQSHTAPV
jgi:hypothetical protein